MQKTLIFLTIIFFLTVVNSQAFFGKLKVVCIDSAVIEKSDYIKFNAGTLPITQNNYNGSKRLTKTAHFIILTLEKIIIIYL